LAKGNVFSECDIPFEPGAGVGFAMGIPLFTVFKVFPGHDGVDSGSKFMTATGCAV
jgi:hypothetical protein